MHGALSVSDTYSARASSRAVLVTGGSGCLGAWVVRQLVDAGVRPVVLHRGVDRRRLEMLLTAEELAQVKFVIGDVSHAAAIDAAMDGSDVDGVIHLAGLLIPACAVDPVRGALVNVVGTINVFEAVKRRRDRIAGVVYASSNAMYEASDGPPDGELLEDADAHPRTHYGVYKQANEGTARTYWFTDGLPSVGIRPWALFGVGRDQGLTSSPSKAMLAAALGVDYEIAFGSPIQLQYAPDVARAFVRALDAGGGGARIYNMGGPAISMGEVVAAIEEVQPAMRGRILVSTRRLPYPPAFASSIHEALDLAPATPFRTAVRETVTQYQRLAVTGRIGAEGLH